MAIGIGSLGMGGMSRIFAKYSSFCVSSLTKVVGDRKSVGMLFVNEICLHEAKLKCRQNFTDLNVSQKLA